MNIILSIIIGTVVASGIYARGTRLPVEAVAAPLPMVMSPTPSPTATPTPTPSKHEIVGFIAKTFEPEGTAVVVRAINCFYSESGLRAEAVSKPNTNGTRDAGVAQINDVHKMSIADRVDYKKNIEKAYKIYKGRGSNFSAWYGTLCN